VNGEQIWKEMEEILSQLRSHFIHQLSVRKGGRHRAGYLHEGLF
jgi:hypothetical protein